MVFWVTVYLSTLLLIGYLIVCVTLRGKPQTPLMIFALSGACGAGALGFLLFWASLLGFVPSRGIVGTMGGLAAAMLCAWAWRQGRAGMVLPKWNDRFQVIDLLALLPVALGVYVVVTGFAGALRLPMDKWDAFAIWMFKAKVVSGLPLNPIPAVFQDLSMAYSHPRYPLMVPMLVAGLWGTIGQQDVPLARALLGLFYGFLPLILYSALRWRLNRLPAALLATAQVALPTAFHWAMPGTADMALTTFYAASVCFLIKWLALRQTPDLVLAGLFSVFMAFTKNEGMALGAVNFVVAASFGLTPCSRFTMRSCAVFTTVVLAMLLLLTPWFVWSSGLSASDEDYVAHLTPAQIATNLSRLSQTARAMWGQFIDPAGWGSYWALVPCAAALGWRAWRQSWVWAAWVLLLGHLGLYVLAYLISPWADLQELIDCSLDRLLLHISPLVALLAALHWPGSQAPATTESNTMAVKK